MPKGRRIKGVACDAEGTVLSVEELHFDGFSFAAASYGIPITPEDILHLPGIIGAGDASAIEIIKQTFDRLEIDTEEFRQRKMERYNSLLPTVPIELRPGWRDVYERLRDLEIPVAIASLTPADQAEFLFQKTGLWSIVPRHLILLREDVTHVKPNPEVFVKAAQRMGVEPENMLVFGDSTKDMLAARAAGAIPIAVPYYNDAAIHEHLWESGAARIYCDWRNVNIDDLLREIAEGVIS